MKNPSPKQEEDVASDSFLTFSDDDISCQDATKLQQELMFWKGAMKAREEEMSRLLEEKNEAIESKFRFMAEMGGLKKEVEMQAKMLVQAQKEKEEAQKECAKEIKEMTNKLSIALDENMKLKEEITTNKEGEEKCAAENEMFRLFQADTKKKFDEQKIVNVDLNGKVKDAIKKAEMAKMLAQTVKEESEKATRERKITAALIQLKPTSKVEPTDLSRKEKKSSRTKRTSSSRSGRATATGLPASGQAAAKKKKTSKGAAASSNNSAVEFEEASTASSHYSLRTTSIRSKQQQQQMQPQPSQHHRRRGSNQSNNVAARQHHHRPGASRNSSCNSTEANAHLATIGLVGGVGTGKLSTDAITVTPAAGQVNRHLKFDHQHGHQQQQKQPAASASVSKASAALLKRGIIDLFDASQPAWSRRPSCQCPADVSFVKGSDVACAYMAQYGAEFWAALKERERADMKLMASYLLSPSAAAAAAAAASARRSKKWSSAHSSPEKSENGDNGEDDDDSEPDTPLPVSGRTPKILNVGRSDGGGESEDEEEEEEDSPEEGKKPPSPEPSPATKEWRRRFWYSVEHDDFTSDEDEDSDKEDEDDEDEYCEDEDDCDNTTETSPSSSQQSKEDNSNATQTLVSSRPLPRQPLLTSQMRAILVNWLVEVSTEYPVSEDALHLAVTLLDHLLVRGPREGGVVNDENQEVFIVRPSDFQALGCACAWIASKFEDRSPPSVEDFAYISDHSFTTQTLQALETRVCKELEFRLHRVTPHHFLNLFLKASHACPCRACQFDYPILRDMACYFLELSRLSYKLSHKKPSLLTAACIYLARATLGLREQHPKRAVHASGYWTHTLQYYTGYSRADLRTAVDIIHEYQLKAESETHVRGIYVKYGRTARHNVSLKTALRKEDLGLFEEECNPFPPSMSSSSQRRMVGAGGGCKNHL